MWTEEEIEYFEFLESLRASGVTGMSGTVPYLMEEFGLKQVEAQKVFSTWMNNYSSLRDALGW